LTLELANICNLHCSYCLRAEDALYSPAAKFFPLDLLKRILVEAKEIAAISRVSFTGGEPTLHPQFAAVLEVVAGAGLTTSFVTNGWHFERIWPALVANRAALTHVAFSLDGITRAVHDGWRGVGSFDRLVRAFTRCYRGNLPFVIKLAIRRDTFEHLEEISIFAARMGASGIDFFHVLPTSDQHEGDSTLSSDERRIAEQEIATLARILKTKVSLDVGYYNTDESPPCSPLAGASFNVDYRGRLTLCCNLSGFRGSVAEPDVVADLNVESFASAYTKLLAIAAEQLQRRKDALASWQKRGVSPDLYTGSPCLFCLQSYGKIPWHKDDGGSIAQARSLPVYNAVT
jgi:MoaA/NifB/PqqE/SkfB family radical SAM enzyme